MILTLIVAFISLLFLIISHEFGHFILAKKFGMKVEEFGIGYPPKLWGKKYGETLYSINLLPFGAFVRILGHEERVNDPRSFTAKPIWQRSLVILGGVISFWIICFILMTFLMMTGMPMEIGDDETAGFTNSRVQLLAVAPNSPASSAGLKVGDTILSVEGKDSKIKKVETVGELQSFIKDNSGKNIVIVVQRGREVFDVMAEPRKNPPQNEGALGVALIRTGLKTFPWYQAPIEGAKETWNLTITIVDGWRMVLSSLFSGHGLPQGAEVRGIVGIFDLFVQTGEMGSTYFIRFVAIIAVSLALVNVLPIPALDGGWFVLLMIEAVRKKPIDEKWEKRITSFFFILLILLMIFITFKDILRYF